MAVQQQLSQFGGPSSWGVAGPQQSLSDADKRLCDACRNGDESMARQALDQGANPLVQFRLALGEITPIFLCASKGHKKIATLLKSEQYRVDINKQMDFDGTIPLHHAASNDQHEMCEWLVEQGSDPNSRDKLGRTPLMDAAEIGSMRCVETLLDTGKADINMEDNEHHTALSYCLDYVTSREDDKFYQVSKFLIKNGAEVNYAGKFSNRTLLHYAAGRLDLEYVKELVTTQKAAVSSLDNDGKTPLDYAQDSEADSSVKDPVVEFLKQNLHTHSGGCTIL